MAEKDQEFVEYMVRSIVNHPDDVRAERTIDERGVLITLHVNPEDMGYVIGREGQTARSLRTLLRIVGAKSNARVNLKIYEPEEARQARMIERGQQPGAVTNDAANRPDFSALDDLKI